MSSFYTGKGDDGTTGTLGSARVRKDSGIIGAIGDVDELNSAIGVAIANVSDEHLGKMLQSVQNELFIVGSELAASINGAKGTKSRIDGKKIDDIEKCIEELSSTLPQLKRFVMPGGSVSGAYLHLARSVCRRAERSVVGIGSEADISPELKRYLNRLSSFLFAAALYVNKKEGVDETNPSY